MVGQKLVDTLCKETQERDVRNEILCGSSHLCSLLKNLALATKHAVLKYPSPAALGHLQAEAQKLEQHTRQFRGTLEWASFPLRLLVNPLASAFPARRVQLCPTGKANLGMHQLVHAGIIEWLNNPRTLT